MTARPASAATLVILLAVAFRLVFAAGTGLGIDESYMVAAASRFDWSYFDHPPVAWWLELAARWLFGGQAPLIVRLPFLALSVITSWLLYALTDRLYGGWPAFWAVVAYSISPVFSLAFGCWVLPDGPLDAALLAAAYALAVALGVGGPARPGAWAAAGFFAGLALLSKYNAALTLAGALLLLASDPESRRQLRRWRPWAAGLLTVAMFSPVILWNARHGWQSFDYQSGRAFGLRLHLITPFTVWGGEALFVLPWLWLPMVALLVRVLRRGPGSRADWMLAMLGVIPVVLFALIGIWSSTRILYHWAAPGYLLLLPMLGRWAADWRPGLRNAVAGMSAALLVSAAMLIVVEIQTGFLGSQDLRFPPGKSPLLQAVDWNSAAKQLRAQATPGTAVAALRWYDAGKIGYALAGALPVSVFGPRPHQFGISTPPASLIGHDVLLLAMPGDVSAITAAYAPYFASLRPAPALTVVHNGDVLLVIPVLLGTDLLRAP